MTGFQKRNTLIVVSCSLLLAGSLFGCRPADPQAEPTTDTPQQLEQPEGSSESSELYVVGLDGSAVDPFAQECRCRVFVFITTDCPIANRYAPKLQRLADKLKEQGVLFNLVYPNAGDTVDEIRQHLSDYRFECEALRDVEHALVKRVRATVTPEAAVFDSANQLVYCGRIDNWYVDFGKNRPEPTEHNLRDAVDAVLKGETIPAKRVKAVGCYIP
ncbi:MAG: hypothetical protein AB8G99_15940 [Planctomycetaceae bacterium]